MADGMLKEMEKEASARWADKYNQELAKRFDELQHKLLESAARCDAQERQAIHDKLAWEAAVQQERGRAERLLREQQLKEQQQRQTIATLRGALDRAKGEQLSHTDARQSDHSQSSGDT